MIGTQRLEVLQQVARHGSLAGAARALACTQPAIAHHMTELEREVGTPLVVRHGRGVRLTDAGAALAAHADAVLSRLAAARDEVAAIAGLRAGRVRIAAYPTAAATIVPGAIAALLADHPGVDVSLRELEPPEALAALRAGEVDLAVTFRYPEAPVAVAAGAGIAGAGRSTDPAGAGAGARVGVGAAGASGIDRGLAVTALSEDPIDVVVPADHPAAGRDAHDLADLARETWVAGCDRCRAHLVAQCRMSGFEPRVAFTTDDFVTQQALVAAGLAVAAMPRSTLGAHADPGLRAAPCRDLGRRVVEVVLAGDPVPPAVHALRSRLVAAHRR
ncbi:MAG TPA: LysR family transcriptional regulator [Acidimicrobiales bacterium]|nr:LysR family transcriptional regulator [Acidimicrobiales bacterium]